MQQNISDQGNNKKEVRKSRWQMRGLSIPSFVRSRSSDSRDGDPPGRSIRGVQSKISFWKRKSANITDYDPTYRVIYLGNVLTGWAKGDGCVDKPLSTLWRNHIGSDKPDIMMKVTVVSSGLRAVTKEHGLTEYWANRITYSVAHPSYPRVFCWIYRHEGRKMKQELRCHAVLCPKEEKARQMATNLQDRLHQALVDFKKDKISRQNARLSLANSIHDNPSMPYRKLLLQAGTSNYKPPIERSKSAPKLTSIEEAELEEEEEDYEEDEDLVVPEHHVAQVHSDPLTVRFGEESRVPPLPNSRSEFSSVYCVEESDEEEDEITDYLGSIEVDSAQSSSPASQGRSGSVTSTQESSPNREPDCNSLSDHSDSGNTEGLEEGMGKMKVSEQDTISDESGYSEEPISGRDVTVVKVTGEPGPCDTRDLNSSSVNHEHKLNIQLNDEESGFRISSQSIQVRRSSTDSIGSTPRDSITDSLTPQEGSPRSPSPIIKTSPPRVTDLSVKSVLLSEFTTSEKLKYIERSNLKPGKPPLVLNRQEFCINI